MFTKLEEVEKRYNHLNEQMSDPKIIARQQAFQQYAREQSELAPVVAEYRMYKKIKAISINTDAYPAFPTDLQAQWMALMTKANGQSIITENIYQDRFTHIAELSRFGARINLNKNIAILKKSEGPLPVMVND